MYFFTNLFVESTFSTTISPSEPYVKYTLTRDSLIFPKNVSGNKSTICARSNGIGVTGSGSLISDANMLLPPIQMANANNFNDFIISSLI